MKPRPARRSGLALALLFVAVLSSKPSATLIYVSSGADSGQDLLLRRDGDRLVIVNRQSRAIVASAPARGTERVVVVGAADRDDTLTLDLSSPLSLPRGIDYDGGSRGWDTLVVTGGSVENERVTQLTPHDGVFDLDGLVLRYTNLEPITDLTPAASLIVDGTAGMDTVTIADSPDPGEATISSPTFESYTFANKTAVVFDGHGGGDSVNFANPNPAAGLQSLIIQNVATVGQTDAVNYLSFGVSATGTVTLNQFSNNVANIEVTTQTGDIDYVDVDGVTIGGVSAALSGLRVISDGSVNVQVTGDLILADTDGAEMVRSGATSGSVTLITSGTSGAIRATVNNKAIVSPAGAAIAGAHDIFLGTAGSNFDNDVLAWGDVVLIAGQDLSISGDADVLSDAFGGGSGGNASANVSRNFLLGDTTGAGASFGSSGSAGGSADVSTTVGSVVLTAPSASALFSSSGLVTVTTARLVIAATSGISAAQLVLIQSSTGGLDLGSATDAGADLELSDAEADRITTSFLLVYGSGSVTVTQPMTVSTGLGLLTEGTFGAAGAGSLNVPMLQFQYRGNAPRTWTINATGVSMTPGPVIPYSGAMSVSAVGGSGDDIFDVTPAASTVIVVAGGTPDFPTLPGDTLNIDDTNDTTSPFVTSTQTETGFTGSFTFGNHAPVVFNDIETLDAATDLAIAKTDGASVETPGTSVVYTIVATNAGSLGIVNAAVIDALPAAITGAVWSCTASAESSCPANGSGSINALVTLAAGGTATFTVTGTINSSATGTLSNTATIQLPPGPTDTNPGNNEATDSDTLLVLTTLSTNASAGVVLGGQVHDTATLANATFPVGTITFNLYGPNDATCSGGTVFTSTVPVAGNGDYDSPNFTPTEPGTHRWVASYSGDGVNAASSGACNDANESVTVTQTADIALTKIGPASATAGANVTYTITATNNGSNAATGVTVTDTLPSGTTLVSATPTQGACVGTTTVTCGLGSIANGASAAITLIVSTTEATPFPISNTATVATTPPDLGPGNNSSTATTARTCSTLIATPAVLPAVIAGDPYSQMFALTNGTAPATFTLTGTIPAGLSFSGDTLSGVTAERGAFPVTLNATDANGCTGSFTYSIVVSRERSLVIGAGEGGGAGVRAFGLSSWTPRLDVTAYDPPFAGGVSVAQGDTDGDGRAEVITGAGPGGTPLVRVLNGVTGAERLSFLAYDATMSSGIEVAAGDVNGDGIADIITVPGYGGPPLVRVFDGYTGAGLQEFFGMPATWTNGLHIGAGDIDGDGLVEIIVGSGSFGPPLVQVFDGTGALRAQLLPYDPSFQGGVYVAGGDVNGDGFADVVTGAGQGGGPHVRVFDGATGDPIAGPLGGFFAYSTDFAGGVRVAAGDFDGDGFAEVITGAGPGGGPHVRVWNGATGADMFGVLGFDPPFPYGVFVAGPLAAGRMAIDLVEVGGGTFRVAGWAFQETSTAGSGTDAIHAWAYPVAGGSPIFAGAAASRAARADVAAVYGGEFLLSGFDFTGALAPGTYDLVIFVRNDTTQQFSQRRAIRITVP